MTTISINKNSMKTNKMKIVITKNKLCFIIDNFHLNKTFICAYSYATKLLKYNMYYKIYQEDLFVRLLLS